jgi:hypothetical protein
MNKLFTRTYKLGTFKNGKPCLFSFVSLPDIRNNKKDEADLQNIEVMLSGPDASGRSMNHAHPSTPLRVIETAKHFENNKVKTEIVTPDFIYNVHEI